MSIEQQLAALTAAVEANTAALKGAGGSTASTGRGKAADKGDKGTSETKKDEVKSKHSRAEMTAALNEVKEQKGASVAKGLISEHGGVSKMADIPDSKIDAVYDAAKKAVGGDDDEGRSDDGL